MQGEKIWEEIGQVTVQRVLPPVDGMPTMEITFQAHGTILGLQENAIGTYVATMQPDGTLRGSGHGVLMTEDGGGATWEGSGLGKLTGRGMGASYRGTITFRTQTESLMRLNGTVCAFEYEVDETNKTEGVGYEWK